MIVYVKLAAKILFDNFWVADWLNILQPIRHLFHVDKLNLARGNMISNGGPNGSLASYLEFESAVRGDSWDLLRAVGKLGRDLYEDSQKRVLAKPQSVLCTHGQLPLTTDGHTVQTLVPTLDNLTGTKTEVEGLTAGVGVELLAVLELADVSASRQNEPRSTNS
jgi:hypothetical protein